MIAVIIIMIATNILVVGCVHYAFWQYGKYQDSRILGVTLTKEQYEKENVQNIVMGYKTVFRRLMIVGYITSFVVMVPFNWYMSIWLILELVWIFGIIGLVQWVYIQYHKRLYGVKKKEGWVCGQKVNEITIDTRLSLVKDKMPLSAWYFIPSIIIIALPLASRAFRAYLLEDLEMAVVILGCMALVKAAYILLYYLFSKRKSVIYSQNSEINIACNRLSKRGFSIIFIVASTLDSVSYLVIIGEQISMAGISMVSVVIFCIIQSGIVAGMIYGLHIIKKKRGAILQDDATSYIVDEDEYWASGFYCNPNDNRLLVAERENSMSMGFNMAKKSAWVITIGTIIGTVVLLGWTATVCLRFDFVEPKYMVEDNFQIQYDFYSLTVEFDEIESIKLVEDLPDVRISKDNGAATDQYSIGCFRIRNQGRCHLYVYHGYDPIVEIKRENDVIYFNSKTEGATERYYEEIVEKMKAE